MGTIAARDCLRVLELTEQVLAASLLAVQQAVQLRIARNELVLGSLTTPLQQMLETLQQQHQPVAEDRALEPELRQLIAQIQQQHWPLYTESEHENG